MECTLDPEDCDGMKPNVILIVCDAMRQDINAKTPNIDRLLKDGGVSYKNAIAAAPSSLSAHASIFTGMYPRDHGIYEKGKLNVKEFDVILENAERYEKFKDMLLPQKLKDMGYSCGGLSTNPWITGLGNFDLGFDWYFFLDTFPNELMKEYGEGEEAKKKLDETRRALNYPQEKGSLLINNMITYGKLTQPFFLFINFFEPHNPYKGEVRKEIEDNFSGARKIAEDSVKRLKEEYVKEIEYIDRRIGRFIDILKDRELYDNTMIIVLGDHGQAFNEHGYMYHGIYLYDEIVRVPLIIKYPSEVRVGKIEKGYQSLTNIKSLILEVIEKGTVESITTEKVFCEAYGMDESMPQGQGEEFFTKYHNKRRIALYKGEYKLMLNVNDNKIEEFSRQGKEVERDNGVVNDLLKELDIFMKKM